MGMVALFLVFTGLVVGVVPGALGAWLRGRASQAGRGGSWPAFAALALAGAVAFAGLGVGAAFAYPSDPAGPTGPGLTASNAVPVLTAAFVLGLSPGVGVLVGALAVLRRPGGPDKPPPRAGRARRAPPPR